MGANKETAAENIINAQKAFFEALITRAKEMEITPKQANEFKQKVVTAAIQGLQKHGAAAGLTAAKVKTLGQDLRQKASKHTDTYIGSRKVTAENFRDMMKAVRKTAAEAARANGTSSKEAKTKATERFLAANQDQVQKFKKLGKAYAEQ